MSAIVDWKPAPDYCELRSEGVAETPSKRAWREISWVLVCIKSMGKCRLIPYGSPDTCVWWADGYESQRREELEKS